ncbi:MAG: hypothetical protein ACLTDR_00665 [Adlercreutzia equolifaciens]
MGHACQQRLRTTRPWMIRGHRAEAVNLASNAWIFLLAAGIVCQTSCQFHHGVVHHARRGGAIFQLVTLPGRVQRLPAPRMAYMGQDLCLPAQERARRASTYSCAPALAHLPGPRPSPPACCASVAARPAPGVNGSLLWRWKSAETTTGRGGRPGPVVGVGGRWGPAKDAPEEASWCAWWGGECAEVSDKPGHKGRVLHA